MIAEWRDPTKDTPPMGIPLIVTIHRDWQNWTETLGPVYYMKSPADGKVQFRTSDNWDGAIGPDHIRVIAWDYWPDAFQSGDAYAR